MISILFVGVFFVLKFYQLQLVEKLLTTVDVDDSGDDLVSFDQGADELHELGFSYDDNLRQSLEFSNYDVLNGRLEEASKLSENRHIDRALLLYKRIRSDFPNHYIAYSNAASLYLTDGEFSKGIVLLQQALWLLRDLRDDLSYNRSYSGILAQLGVAYSYVGDSEKAVLVAKALRMRCEGEYADAVDQAIIRERPEGSQTQNLKIRD